MNSRTYLKCALIVSLCILIAIPALAQVAQRKNTGGSGVPDQSWGAHQLSQGVASSTASVGRVLYAPSEEDDPAFRAAIAAFTGGVVDYYDARYATPSVETLATYDCVMTWANYAYADNVLFGNNLAAFVDGGGSVILGAFAAYTSGNYLAGQIMTSAYSPAYSPSGWNHFSWSTYAGNGTTQIHTGVASYGATYRDYLALQGSGAQDGSYTDNEIAQAYRPDFRVIYSNGAGGSPIDGNAPDWPRLIANACAAGVLIIDIDIKFCSDPNAFNCGQKGKVPVTIFGDTGLDVGTIDLSSVKLCLADLSSCIGPPLSWSTADRGDPDTDIGAPSCKIVDGIEQYFLNPDGFVDLDVAFDAGQVATLIGCPIAKGTASQTLVVTGKLLNGREFTSKPVGDVGVDQLYIQK